MADVGSEVTEQVGTAAMEQVTQWIPSLGLLHPWAFFAIMVAVAIVLSQVAAWVLRVFAKAIASRTKTRIDDIIIEKVQQPLAWIIFSALLYVAFAPLEFSPSVARALSGALLALNIFVVAWLIHRLATAIFEIWRTEFAKKTDTIVDDTLLPIASKAIKVLIWILAGLAILASWGVQIGPLLAGLGLAGLALGLALQDSLKNVFGGVSLALDNAYRVGDKVKLADGTVGVIHDISLRSTQISTYDGDLVMVPNGKIANDNIYTYAQPAPRSRGVVNFGVEYGSDIEKVKKLVLSELSRIAKVQKDPAPAVWFMYMGPYALEMRAYFWLADYNDVWVVEREATDRIYAALRKAKVGIPFPTQTLHIKKG